MVTYPSSSSGASMPVMKTDTTSRAKSCEKALRECLDVVMTADAVRKEKFESRECQNTHENLVKKVLPWFDASPISDVPRWKANCSDPNGGLNRHTHTA
jgi:hypothetical protein